MDRFYVTTPIYYVTDKPHIGHAYTTVAADVLARYYRLKLGETNVFFLTGTDEHGAKVAEAAATAGEAPAEFVTRLAKIYEGLWHKLDVKPNFFIRTTDPRHEAYAQAFLQDLYHKGEITKGVYEGLYCLGCEKFITESEMVDGRCPDHPNKELIRQKEENYFFSLAKWAPRVRELIDKNEIEIAPEYRRNEILARLAQGVHDVSISRAQVSWGIPVPWDNGVSLAIPTDNLPSSQTGQAQQHASSTIASASPPQSAADLSQPGGERISRGHGEADSGQTIYVWFEALLNYASALEIEKEGQFWPPNLQLMGKEILWFHAVIWPAMLLASGKEHPKTLFAHGWFTVNGQKMSKTVGNVIDPVALVDQYGTDAVRYFLLMATTFGEDGDISLTRFAAQYQADLSNGLGNLLQRTLVLRNKFGVTVERGAAPRCAAADEQTERLAFDAALAEIWKLVGHANQQLENEKPWVEPDPQKRIRTLTAVTRQLETIAASLQPYLPQTSENIVAQLASGEPRPLFPRIEQG